MDWETEDKGMREHSLVWENILDDGEELDDNRLLYLLVMQMMHSRQDKIIQHRELIQILTCIQNRLDNIEDRIIDID